MIAQELMSEIEQAVGGEIKTLAPLSAANNAQIYQLQLPEKKTLVAKIAAHGLDIEAFMLDYLKEKSELPLPEVFYSSPQVMVMEYIRSDWDMDFKSQMHAAELLAHLHNVTADQFGFEKDTLIGSLHQPNPQSDMWIPFFVEHRLLYMAREALSEGKIDKSLMKKIEKLAAKLPGILKEPKAPALIHGDVWGGNILAGQGEILAFLDPAIYYADSEIELAFTSLFSTFSDSFYDKYSEIRPIESGFFEDRLPIYNLYPLLVHTRLFGRSYIRKIENIINRFT